MKKLFIGLLVVVVLIVGGVAAFVATFDVERYRPEIETQATNAIGRKVELAGPMSITFWPSLAITIRDVTIANPSWTEAKHLLRAGSIDLSIAIMPLLQRQIEIERVFLDDIDLALEETANGEQNWRLPMFDQAGSAQQQSADTGNGAAGPGLDLAVSQISLNQIRLSHRKARPNDTPLTHELVLNRVTVRAPRGERLGLDAEGVFAGEEFNIGLRAGTLAEIQSKTPFTMDFTAAVVGSDLQVQGEVDLSQGFAGDFSVAMQGPRFADLSRIIVGNPSLPLGEPYRVLTRARVGAMQYQLSDILVEFGASRMAGSLNLAIEDGRPTATGALVSETLTPDDFAMAPRDPSVTEEGRASGGRAPSEAPAPIPWSALQTVDVDLSVDLKAIQAANGPIGSGKGRIKLNGGRLDAAPIEVNVGGGRILASLAAETTGAFGLQANGAGIDYGATLAALGVTQAVEGSTDFAVNLAGRGATVPAILSGLNGQITMDGGNGRILTEYLDSKWIDKIREASPLPLDFESTLMHCAITSIGIENGLAEITETMVDTAALTLAAAGRYSLAEDQLDMVMRVRPNTRATAGLSAPLKVSGPLSNASINIDAQGLARGLGDLVGVNLGSFPVPVNTNPDGGAEACRLASRQATNNPQSPVGGALQNLLQGQGGEGSGNAVEDTLQQLPEGTGDAVRGLFDRLTR
ncbi:MAG: AsmA family protein [Alphaproteobacteria bacterium]|nr:AsmA family protein [Alphaproteobacteria bacterium SS10]